MRLRLTPPNTEAFEADYTGQADSDLAKRLTNLVQAIEGSATILIDGGWGVGKTTFALRWQHLLKDGGIATVYLNAFGLDYVETPFVALSGAIVDAADSGNAKGARPRERFVAAASKIGRSIAVVSAKMAVRAATFGIADVSDFEALKDVASDPLSDAAGDATKEAISSHRQRKREIDDLKEALAELASAQDCGKLVIIVDELDRCRPDFALGLLEITKHFFGSTGVVFVLVSNLRQLEASVLHQYGEKTEAHEYLRRFYDLRVDFTLDYRDRHDTKLRAIIQRLGSGLIAEGDNQTYCIDYMTQIARAYRLSLRDVENIFTNLAISYAVDARRYRPAILVCFLSTLKLLDPIAYKKAKIRELTYIEVQSFIDERDWKDFDTEKLKKLLRWHLDPTVDISDPEFREYGSGQWQLDRHEVIPHLVNSVIDLFEVPSMQELR